MSSERDWKELEVALGKPPPDDPSHVPAFACTEDEFAEGRAWGMLVAANRIANWLDEHAAPYLRPGMPWEDQQIGKALREKADGIRREMWRK